MRFTACAHAVVDGEGDAGLRAHLAALQLQPELKKEQLFENQADVRRGTRLLQPDEALADLGPMRLPEGTSAIDELHAPTHGRRNRIGKVRGQVLQHAVNHPAKPARSEAAVARSLVDGHDAAHLERLPLLLVATALRFGGVVQDFELRLQNLEAMAAAITASTLPYKATSIPGAKLVLQVRRVEPEAFQGVAALPHGHLKDRHAAGAKQPEGTDLGNHAGHLARPQALRCRAG